MTNKRVVLSTCGSLEEARQIATYLVEKRLAACVNIVPQVESVYLWKGELETAAEWMLVIKSTQTAFEHLRDTLAKLHSYEVPECIEIAVTDGSAAYLKWIGEAVPE